jgi:hypothetical protein
MHVHVLVPVVMVDRVLKYSIGDAGERGNR